MESLCALPIANNASGDNVLYLFPFKFLDRFASTIQGKIKFCESPETHKYGNAIACE